MSPGRGHLLGLLELQWFFTGIKSFVCSLFKMCLFVFFCLYNWMHLWLTGGHLNLSTLAKINRITYEATDCLYFTFICEEKHKHNKMAIFHKNVPTAKKIHHSTVEIILKSIKETLYPKTCKSFQRTPLCVRIFPFAQLCKMDHVETIICISDT